MDPEQRNPCVCLSFSAKPPIRWQRCYHQTGVDWNYPLIAKETTVSTFISLVTPYHCERNVLYKGTNAFHSRLGHQHGH